MNHKFNRFLSAFNAGRESALATMQERGVKFARDYCASKLRYGADHRSSVESPAIWAYWKGYAQALRQYRNPSTREPGA